MSIADIPLDFAGMLVFSTRDLDDDKQGVYICVIIGSYKDSDYDVMRALTCTGHLATATRQPYYWTMTCWTNELGEITPWCRARVPDE